MAMNVRFASAVLSAAIVASSAPPCAVFGKAWLGTERVVIVWDSKTHTEHFVREATFGGKGGDIGFVVPTPTVPELHKVDPAIFASLESIAGMSKPGAAAGGSGSFGGRQAVEVVRVQSVDGLEGVTLAARNSSALQDWLGKNGFAVPAGTADWAAKYIRMGWYLTAFRYKRDDNTTVLVAKPFRLTFKADGPFYPYHEPATSEPKSRPRRLELFVIAGADASGFQSDHKPRREWWVRPRLIRGIGGPEWSILQGQLGIEDGPQSPVLTAFIDDTVVRPPIDLAFLQVLGSGRAATRVVDLP